MSQMTATARVGLRAPVREHQAARLHVVTGDAARRSGVGFVILCTGLLVATMLTLLVLNTKRAEASFKIGDLQATSGMLADTQNTLRAGLDLQESPAHLAASAAARGMVPATSTAFIRLSDGKVLGVATPTKAQPDFKVVGQVAPGLPTAAGHVAPGVRQGAAAAIEGAGVLAKKPGSGTASTPAPKSTTKSITKSTTTER